MEANSEFMQLFNETKQLMGPLPAQQIFWRALREFVERKTKMKSQVAGGEPNNSRSISKGTKVQGCLV